LTGYWPNQWALGWIGAPWVTIGCGGPLFHNHKKAFIFHARQVDRHRMAQMSPNSRMLLSLTGFPLERFPPSLPGHARPPRRGSRYSIKTGMFATARASASLLLAVF
jgi:hypothetical protein